MSDDLIRRQDAIDAMYQLEAEDIETYGCSIPEGFYAKPAVEALEALSLAEPERKKGKWIDEKINSYTSRTYCSECCSSAPFVYKSDDYYGNHAHGETAKTKFCPNCGADMRGTDE